MEIVFRGDTVKSPKNKLSSFYDSFTFPPSFFFSNIPFPISIVLFRVYYIVINMTISILNRTCDDLLTE